MDDYQMRIYLIDDRFIVIKTLKDFLSDLGHTVVCFNSISEFLKNQEKENSTADLIIVYICMPKEDGIKKINQIHKKYPNTAIVVMSFILPFQEAIAHGVYSCLEQPVKFAELELILAQISKTHLTQGINDIKKL